MRYMFFYLLLSSTIFTINPCLAMEDDQREGTGLSVLPKELLKGVLIPLPDTNRQSLACTSKSMYEGCQEFRPILWPFRMSHLKQWMENTQEKEEKELLSGGVSTRRTFETDITIGGHLYRLVANFSPNFLDRFHLESLQRFKWIADNATNYLQMNIHAFPGSEEKSLDLDAYDETRKQLEKKSQINLVVLLDKYKALKDAKDEKAENDGEKTAIAYKEWNEARHEDHEAFRSYSLSLYPALPASDEYVAQLNKSYQEHILTPRSMPSYPFPMSRLKEWMSGTSEETKKEPSGYIRRTFEGTIRIGTNPYRLVANFSPDFLDRFHTESTQRFEWTVMSPDYFTKVNYLHMNIHAFPGSEATPLDLDADDATRKKLEKNARESSLVPLLDQYKALRDAKDANAETTRQKWRAAVDKHDEIFVSHSLSLFPVIPVSDEYLEQ